MKLRPTDCRRARLARTALLACALAATACGRPADENWLRVTSLKDDGGVAVAGITSGIHWVSASTGASEIGGSDYLTVAFVNQSATVGYGTATSGAGVTVEQVRISYSVPGYSLPTATAAMALYVPPSSSTDSSGVTTTTESEVKVPVVGASLKGWLAASVPEEVRRGGLSGSAQLVFSGRTDDGSEVETKAGVAISFVNEVPEPTAGTSE